MDTSTTTTREQAQRERLAESLRELVGDAEQLLRSGQRSGSGQFNAARDRVETQLQRARTELDSLTDTAGHRFRRAVRATDNALHRHPYAAVGLGVGLGIGIGLIAGALTARR